MKLILDEEPNNFPLIIIDFIYKYYRNQTFDKKISDIMKSYYILTIPFIHLEKDDNEKIPFSLREEKSKENILKNYLINIF